MPTNKKPWLFDPRAFIVDTQRLTPPEAGIYFLLLCHYWVDGGLPNDDRQLAQLVNMDLRTWRRWYRTPLLPFFHDGWRQKRMERDLARADAFQARQRAASKARWRPMESAGHAVDNVERREPDSPGTVRCGKSLNGAQSRHGLPMPRECQYRIKDRVPSIAARESSDVDKSKNRAQTSPLVDGQPTSSSYRSAQARTLRALLSVLGESAYAEAITILADDSTLLDRATKAEQRKPGKGAVVALAGLLHRVP